MQGMLSDIEIFSPDGYRAGEDLGMTDITMAPWGVYEMEDVTLQQRLDYIRRFGDKVIAKT